MESRAKFLGHAIHPMLIVLPLGLLTSAVVFDIIYLITGNGVFPAISYYDIALGIIGGVLAAVFGLWDWLSIPPATRAKTIGLFHGLGNATIIILFALSWIVRSNASGFTPNTLALIFSFAGILLGLVTAWLGGELVDRMGVGIDQGANLDAPSSLGGAARKSKE